MNVKRKAIDALRAARMKKRWKVTGTDTGRVTMAHTPGWDFVFTDIWNGDGRNKITETGSIQWP